MRIGVLFFFFFLIFGIIKFSHTFSVVFVFFPPLCFICMFSRPVYHWLVSLQSARRPVCGVLNFSCYIFQVQCSFDSSFCFFNIQFSAQTLSEACLLMNMFITCILMSCILKLGCFVVLFLLSVFFMFLSWLVLPPSMLGSFY